MAGSPAVWPPPTCCGRAFRHLRHRAAQTHARAEGRGSHAFHIVLDGFLVSVANPESSSPMTPPAMSTKPPLNRIDGVVFVIAAAAVVVLALI